MRFLFVDAALFIEHGVAMEAGRDALGHSGIGRSGVGEHVSSKLLDGEPVIRHIAVQRIDDPVAIFPDRAALVRFKPVGIGVAREIQPRTRPALAIVR